MTAADVLPASVMRRRAVVHVRQSSQLQVQANLESKRRQYDLVEVARQHGFHDVEVIDDLGRSAHCLIHIVAQSGPRRSVAVTAMTFSLTGTALVSRLEYMADLCCEAPLHIERLLAIP